MSVVSYNTGSSSYIPSVPNGSGGSSLMKHEGESHYFTWFVKNDYSMKDFYGRYNEDDLGTNTNGRIEIKNSYSPFIAEVDWGDGNIELYSSSNTVEGHEILFRVMLDDSAGYNSEHYWPKMPDGSPMPTIPPHKYADGDKEKERSITVRINNGFTEFYSNVVEMVAFPIIVSSNLKYLSINYANEINSIPFDSFRYIPNLESLILTALSRSIRYDVIPDSVFDMPNLIKLHCNALFNLSDIDSCGIRNINKLTNLQSAEFTDCNLWKYVKEFNDLNKLQILYIPCLNNTSGNYDIDLTPYMDEVDTINQNLRKFIFVSSTFGPSARTKWPEGISGKGLDNLTVLEFGDAVYMDISYFPNWVYEMRSITNMNCNYLIQTQERADQLVDVFYDFVVGWEYITMNQNASDGLRNQFYGLSVLTWSLSSDPKVYRPSGVYQAPSGFELGVSNGTPQTPMEKIYVLENNYKQKWIIKPEN